MKNKVTNYGKLLAEIAYFESIGNEAMAEKLSQHLDKAREKDREISKRESDKADSELREAKA